MAHIKTYARLKPSRKPYPGYEVDNNTLKIHITDNKEFVFIDPQQVANRGILSYEVTFTEIFSPDSTQEEVFSVAAKDIIQNFLNGYNGTIFAYGQTGTGKTYTVEGNTHLFCRGLSTRAINMIYQQLARRIDDHISVYLSYLEIYQEVAYDLLNPTSRSSVPILPFTKVNSCEGLQESYLLRGLTLHLAPSEEVAHMLLLQGQANRKIAETPTNQRSSRSHAVFTVYLQARKRDSKVTLKSKLHLVDLAGSERVSKTGAEGQQLTEAKSINLSLHHLETVIISLQSDRTMFPNSASGEDKSVEDNVPSQSRSGLSLTSGPSSDGGKHHRFVPYRNSLLTMLLKDSLGGNCLTAMIATISLEPENVGESVSTCRFAQRVARVANNARRNEEIDDKALISKLMQKISCMKQELACVKSLGQWRSLYSQDNVSSVLTQEDRAECARIMDGFLEGTILDPMDAGICDRYRFLECLHVLKERYLQSQAALSQLLTSQQHMEISPSICSETFAEGSCDYNGDQRMAEIFQPGTSYFAGYQQNPDFTMSDGSMDVSEEFFSASDNDTSTCTANTATECLTSERKDTERSSSPQVHSPKRIKLNIVKNTDRTARKQEQEHQPSLESHIRYQKMLETENTLRSKLKALEQQLAELQTYIQWLKNTQADPVRIAKELVVETNQLKCQARFQDRLKKLLERKAKLLSSVSFNRQKSPFIRQCCNKSPNCGESSPRHLKYKAANSKQESPRVNNEKSALKIKDLTFKVAASLNRCKDFKQSQQTSPQIACQQLQRCDTFQQADEDQQETPTLAEQRSHREQQQKIPQVSSQLIDEEPRTYPAISRHQSGKELQQKTLHISNQHLAQEQQRHPAISRQNASHKLQQKRTQVSNQLIDHALSAVSRQHSGKDVQRKTLKISNQYATQEQQNRISDKMSRQNSSPEVQQKSPICSCTNADKEQQKQPRLISQYGVQQQKMSTVSKQLTEQQENQKISNHNGGQEHQKTHRTSKHADHVLQQMTSKIFKQRNNQELQEKIPSKQSGDKELQQNPRTLQYTSQDLQQKTPRIARQHTVQKQQQNARMSKQSADQTVKQKTSKKSKQLVNQELQVVPEKAQQSDDVDVESRHHGLEEEVIAGSQPEDDHKSRNHGLEEEVVAGSQPEDDHKSRNHGLEEEIVAGSQPEDDHKSINHSLEEEVIAGSQPEDEYKSTASSVGDDAGRNVSKVESSSDGSQSTEKQVNTFEDFMVIDDTEKTDYEN